MGIKKKMTTIFSQRTNSRRDKRKEKKKKEKQETSLTDVNQPGCSKWASEVESPRQTPEPMQRTPDIDSTRGETPEIETPPQSPDIDSTRRETPDIETPPQTPEAKAVKQTSRPKTAKREARPKTAKQKADNTNKETAKRTVSNETITLVRPFSVGSGFSSCSELSEGDRSSSCMTPSTVPSSPRHYSDFEDDDAVSCASSRRYFSPDDGDGDDNISTISIYSVASSDGARSRILPKTPPKNLQRTFSGTFIYIIDSLCFNYSLYFEPKS